MPLSPRSRLVLLGVIGIVLIGMAAAFGPLRAYGEGRYLDEALRIIEQHSIRGRSADWATIRQKAHDRITYSSGRSDTYEAIRAVLRATGDNHSGVIEPQVVAQLASVKGSDNPPPFGEQLRDRIAYIRVPGLAGTTAAAATEGATRLQQLVQQMDGGQPCGWVVDLRANGGGNMWPMLAGLGPLLGDGEIGASISSDGTRLVWAYDSGAAMESGRVRARVSGVGYRLRAQSPPVAVLIGPQTASSGEAVAVAFKGRPHTLAFGSRSRGLSTSNNPFRLSDGALLNLSVAVFADREGRRYVDGVEQDRFTPPAETQTSAVDWLRGAGSCSGA